MGDNAKLSSHEEERIKNIERNHAQMLSLGLFGIPKLPEESDAIALGLTNFNDDGLENEMPVHSNVFSFCDQSYSTDDALRLIEGDIIEREDSVRFVSGFLDKAVVHAPGLYVCGLPGSGKTLICKRLVQSHPVPSVVVACAEYANIGQLARGVWAAVVHRVALEIYSAALAPAAVRSKGAMPAKAAAGVIQGMIQVSTSASAKGGAREGQSLPQPHSHSQHTVVQAYLQSKPPKDLFTLVKMLSDLFKYYYSLVNQSDARRQWQHYKWDQTQGLGQTQGQSGYIARGGSDGAHKRAKLPARRTGKASSDSHGFRPYPYNHCIFHLLLDDVSAADAYKQGASLVLMQLSQKCHPLLKVLGTSVTSSSAHSSGLMYKTVHCLHPYSDQSYMAILTRIARRGDGWIELIRPTQTNSRADAETTTGIADTDVDSDSEGQARDDSSASAATAALNNVLDFLLQSAFPIIAMNTKHVGVMVAMARRMWNNVATFLNGDVACAGLIDAMFSGGTSLSGYVSQLKKGLTRNQVLDRIIRQGVQGPCAVGIRDGHGLGGDERESVDLPTGPGQPPKSLLLAQEFACLRPHDLRGPGWVESLTAPQKYLIVACYNASRKEKDTRDHASMQKASGKRSYAKLRNAEMRQSEFQDEDDPGAQRRTSKFDGSFAFDMEALVHAYLFLVDIGAEPKGPEYTSLLGDSNFFGMVSTLVHQFGVLTAVPTAQPRSFDPNHIDLDCHSKSITNSSHSVLYKCTLRKDIVFEIARTIGIQRDMLM